MRYSRFNFKMLTIIVGERIMAANGSEEILSEKLNLFLDFIKSEEFKLLLLPFDEHKRSEMAKTVILGWVCQKNGFATTDKGSDGIFIIDLFVKIISSNMLSNVDPKDEDAARFFCFGLSYAQGKLVEKNEDLAAFNYYNSVEKASEENKNNFREIALNELNRLKQSGVVFCYLGQLHLEKYFEKKTTDDLKKAERYFILAKEQNCLAASTALGCYYLEGLFGKKFGEDERRKKAIEYYENASKEDWRAASFLLEFYSGLTGFTEEIDNEKAISYYTKVIEFYKDDNVRIEVKTDLNNYFRKIRGKSFAQDLTTLLKGVLAIESPSQARYLDANEVLIPSFRDDVPENKKEEIEHSLFGIRFLLEAGSSSLRINGYHELLFTGDGRNKLFDIICEFGPHSEIQELDFSNNKLCLSDVPFLALLFSFLPKLKKIKLDYNYFDYKSLELLFLFWKKNPGDPNIEEKIGKISDFGQKEFDSLKKRLAEGIKRPEHLELLSICANRITDADHTSIFYNMVSSKIENQFELKLDYNFLGWNKPDDVDDETIDFFIEIANDFFIETANDFFIEIANDFFIETANDFFIEIANNFFIETANDFFIEIANDLRKTSLNDIIQCTWRINECSGDVSLQIVGDDSALFRSIPIQNIDKKKLAAKLIMHTWLIKEKLISPEELHWNDILNCELNWSYEVKSAIKFGCYFLEKLSLKLQENYAKIPEESLAEIYAKILEKRRAEIYAEIYAEMYWHQSHFAYLPCRKTVIEPKQEKEEENIELPASYKKGYTITQDRSIVYIICWNPNAGLQRHLSLSFEGINENRQRFIEVYDAGINVQALEKQQNAASQSLQKKPFFVNKNTDDYIKRLKANPYYFEDTQKKVEQGAVEVVAFYASKKEIAALKKICNDSVDKGKEEWEKEGGSYYEIPSGRGGDKEYNCVTWLSETVEKAMGLELGGRIGMYILTEDRINKSHEDALQEFYKRNPQLGSKEQGKLQENAGEESSERDQPSRSKEEGKSEESAGKEVNKSGYSPRLLSSVQRQGSADDPGAQNESAPENSNGTSEERQIHSNSSGGCRLM
jgi:hypothetical protein